MDFLIHTYGNGEFIRLTFNYVSMIFGDANFNMLANIVALLGFVAVMAKAAFNKDGLGVFRTHFAVVFLVLIAFVPKTTVVIIDDIVPANSSIVDNVPLGLGATAGFFSMTGYWLTNTFETVTAVPGFAQTTSSGFLFHQEAFRRVQDASIMGANNKFNFDQFTSSCIIVDGIGHDRFSYEELLDAKDPVSFLSTNLSDADVAQFYYKPSTGANKEIATCKTGFDNIIVPAINRSRTNSYQKIALGFLDDYDRSHNATLAVIPKLAEMGATMLAGHGSSGRLSFHEYLRRELLFKELDKSIAMFANGVGATEASEYIMTKANANRQLTYSMTYELATKKLPKLRMIIEGILYGIFPIIALLAILSPVKVLISYAKALLWISLWPVMFALLNAMIVFYDAKNLNGIVYHYSGFSADAMFEINQYLSETGNITAGLMISLPMITWLLLSGGGTMLSSLTGKVLGGMEKSVESATNEVVEGNGKFAGNNWRTIANQNTVQESNTNNGVAVESLTNRGGTQTDNVAFDGNLTRSYNAPKSSAMHSYVNSQEFGDKISNQYNEAVQKEASAKATLNEQISSTYALIQSRGLGWSSTESRGLTSAYTETESFNELKSKTTESLQSWAKSEGLSEQETATLMGKAGAELGFNLLGTGVGAGLTTNVSTSAQMEQAERHMEQFKVATQGQTVLGLLRQEVTSDAYSQAYGANKTYTDTLNFKGDAIDSAALTHSTAVGQVQSEKYVQDSYFAFSNKLSTDQTAYMVNFTDIKDQQQFEDLEFRAYRGDIDAKNELTNYAMQAFSHNNHRLSEENDHALNVFNAKGAELYKATYSEVVEDNKDNNAEVNGLRKLYSTSVKVKAHEAGVLPEQIRPHIDQNQTAISNSIPLGSDRAGWSSSYLAKPPGYYTGQNVVGIVANNADNLVDDARNLVVENTAEVIPKVVEKAENFVENPVETTVGAIQDGSILRYVTKINPVGMLVDLSLDIGKEMKENQSNTSTESNTSTDTNSKKDADSEEDSGIIADIWNKNPFKW